MGSPDQPNYTEFPQGQRLESCSPAVGDKRKQQIDKYKYMDYKRVSKDNVLTWPLKASAYTSYNTKWNSSRLELLQKHKTVRLPKLRVNISGISRLYRHALVFTTDSITQSQDKARLKENFLFTVEARRLGEGGSVQYTRAD